MTPTNDLRTKLLNGPVGDIDADWALMRKAVAALDERDARIKALEAGLRELMLSCDQGPPMLHDGCGTTIIGPPHPDALRRASNLLTNPTPAKE